MKRLRLGRAVYDHLVFTNGSRKRIAAMEETNLRIEAGVGPFLDVEDL